MKTYQKLTTDVPQIPETGEEAADGTPLCHQKLSAWWLGGGLLMVAALLSGVTVWVLGQIWWSQHGVPPVTKCSSIPANLRFDCYPERGMVVTRDLCESRGCCFVESDRPLDSAGGVPWCFYPPDFPSYVLGSMNETDLGMVGFLTRKAKAYYPRDIMNLQLIVEFETDTRLHVKVTPFSGLWPPQMFSLLCLSKERCNKQFVGSDQAPPPNVCVIVVKGGLYSQKKIFFLGKEALAFQMKNVMLELKKIQFRKVALNSTYGCI